MNVDFIDRGGRDRHREARHRTGDRSTDGTREPPGHADGGDPRERDHVTIASGESPPVSAAAGASR